MARYIIYGAGAIGSILGAGLCHTGQDVVLVGRGRHVEAIRRHGLQLRAEGRLRRIKINAVDNLSKLKPKAEDRLMLTVKAQHTADAARILATVYLPTTPIVALQNAIRNEGILATRFQCVYGGLVEFSANFLEPGIVEHTRNNLVAIGKFPQGFDSVADTLATDLEKAGFRVERSENVMDIKWWKLVLNTNNALLALLGCWLQKGQSDPEIYPLMADVMEESLRVLQRAGIHPQAPGEFPPLDLAIEKLRAGEMSCDYDWPPEERTYPSTWQDLQLKRGYTEVEFLNGEIERLGKEHGVRTPLNSLLLRLVSAMALNRERPGKYSPQEIKSLFEKDKV